MITGTTTKKQILGPVISIKLFRMRIGTDQMKLPRNSGVRILMIGASSSDFIHEDKSQERRRSARRATLRNDIRRSLQKERVQRKELNSLQE
jgi:hypothetical protein